MGVIPVNENEKGFNFDGESSKTFDLFITGGAIFDAPERDVELIEIPGRNGALVQDLGRFKNVTVTYNCALTSTKEHEFVDAMRKVREWLCSKRGYCRLWDDFNPGEYRMAMFKGYIEVTNEAPVVGRFDLSFDCMPQRFLLNGDNPVAVSDGGSIFNPTMFDAKPLLQVWGYGDISINGDIITVQNIPIGELTIANNKSKAVGIYGTTAVVSTSTTIIEGPLDTGDPFTVRAQGGSSVCNASVESNQQVVDSVTYHAVQTSINIDSIPNYHDSFANQTAIFKPVSFVYGTSKTAYCDVVVSATAHEAATPANSLDYSFTMNFRLSYDGQKTITLRQSISNASTSISGNLGVSFNAIVGVSSKSALGNPLYIDLDIGEAYKEEDGELISSNAGVSLPSELPVLKPGANTIAFDNTVTELDIVPRWWEV